MDPAPTPARRQINPAALDPYTAKQKLRSGKVLSAEEQSIAVPRAEFVPIIQAAVGSDVPVNVYSFKVLIPITQMIRESQDRFRRVLIATKEDLDLLTALLTRHFGGITGTAVDPPTIRGVGVRDPNKPAESLEENEHATFEVYAAPIQESDDYFRALRRELQEALHEGVILIERQQVTLI